MISDTSPRARLAQWKVDAYLRCLRVLHQLLAGRSEAGADEPPEERKSLQPMWYG